MSQSDFVFEQGEAIDVGQHGENDYMFASGDPVPNSGQSEFVYQSGTGLGGGRITYSVNGDVIASFEPIASEQSIEDYFAYAEDGTASASGDILQWLEVGDMVVMGYENTSTEDYSLVWVYDTNPNDTDIENYGGEVTTEVTDVSGMTWEVQDDDPGNDEYEWSNGKATAYHRWNNNTDGAAVGTVPVGRTMTIDVVGYYPGGGPYYGSGSFDPATPQSLVFYAPDGSSESVDMYEGMSIEVQFN